MGNMPGASSLPPYDRHELFTHWTLHPWWLLVGVLLLAAYAVGVRRAAAHGVHPRPWRIASFVLGVVVLEVTLASAIDGYAMSLFWMHMVEHLLLIMVVPALLVLGHPISLLRDALPEPQRERFMAVLTSRPIGILTDPLVGILVYAAVIVGTHLTGFMDQMVQHTWLMTAEQVIYLVAGCWLLVPLITAEPIRWQVPYVLRISLLLVAMVPDTVVGIVLMQTPSDPFPLMMGMHPRWAPAPVDDAHIGGGLMWAAGDGLMMVLAIGVVVALIADRSGVHRSFGPWLEGVRRQTMVDHVSHGATDEQADVDADLDPDSDDALAAYNRMLGRLSGGR